MSSLAAARADNFYYPPDFDPKKHQTLNKYNGQHPLRERAAKLDQGILVIRFEVPFNIWCDKCGEHIAKGERFNAEKKAIGSYHSTKILQFTMSHHCGCKITIQTDPKRAEYLVVEGARKKEESYSAADAEVIELPDDEERERRDRDPLYRLEFQQGAKAKALSGAERLAAIQDAADARAADPFALNRTLRAALRGEKRVAAALDVRRAALGLPEAVPLLPASEGDALAAQVAFLTSSARAEAGAETRRKRILEQDIFVASAGGAGAGAVRTVAVVQASAKRQAIPALTGGAPLMAADHAASRMASAGRDARDGTDGGRASEGVHGTGLSQRVSTAVRQVGAQPPTATVAVCGAAAIRCKGEGAANAGVAHASSRSSAAAAATAAVAVRGKAAPGAAALAAAAAARAGWVSSQQPPRNGAPHGNGIGVRAGALTAAVHTFAMSGRGGDIAAAGMKRSLKDRAAELQKRRLGPGAMGLALTRPEL